MSFRKRLLLFLLCVVVAAALDALLAPFIVAHGVRWWIEWTAHREGLTVEMKRIDAPFWRPVTIHAVSVSSDKANGRQVSLQATAVVLDLNLRGWAFGQDVRVLHSLRADQLTGEIRITEKPSPSGPKIDWRPLARLLPDEFEFHDLNLDLATPTVAIAVRGVLLTANPIESGHFFARQISFTAPLLRQTFSDLRGATSWESSRLTIAGIPLARGLDLEALTLDLSRLAKRRVGVDLQLDTYGGTMRASFLARAGEKFVIDLAGSAANISLAQISGAMGFLEPITGSVRASKFTFRGNPGEFLDATASIWIEATDLAWRARRAENVMLGATYYDRRLVVDQLYVRQRENELTVNGELVWPKKLESWARLPFRGQINARIADVNSFAQLFGATTGDFSGALRAQGELDLVKPVASGRLTWSGEEVTFRGVALDSLQAAIRLQGDEVILENLEARHADDFLRGNGTVELSPGHRFSGRLSGAIGDLDTYAPLLPDGWRSGKIGGGATFDWRGDGTLSAHSGTFQLFGHGLQLPVPTFRRPLDVTLEGSYSPQDIFFRTFKLANQNFSLGGFLMMGSNYAELQSFDLALGGTHRAGGTIFLPFSFARWRTTRSWSAAFDEAQKFDIDLAIDHLDLAKLGEALGEPSLGSGVLTGKLAAFGVLRELQLTTDWHLENFGGTKADPNAIDFRGRLQDARLEAETTATFGVSDPVRARASLPLRLEKAVIASGAWVSPAAPFSATLDIPALFLQTLPNEWTGAQLHGLLTGQITWHGRFPTPAIGGEADISNAGFRPAPPWPEVSGLGGHLSFKDSAAVIDSLHCAVDAFPLDLRGSFSVSPVGFGLKLVPVSQAVEVVQEPAAGAQLSAIRLLGNGREQDLPTVQEALVRGTLRPAALSLTLTTSTTSGAPFHTTWFGSSSAGQRGALILRVAAPGSAPPQKFSDSLSVRPQW